MNDLTNLLEQIERYLRTQNNEDLCNDSADLIDFIETVRDDELIKEVVKSKGRRCTCIAYKVECDNCPFGDIDCTDKDLIYNIAKSLIKEDK